MNESKEQPSLGKAVIRCRVYLLMLASRGDPPGTIPSSGKAWVTPSLTRYVKKTRHRGLSCRCEVQERSHLLMNFKGMER